MITYKIHPAIGIARMGDSDESFEGRSIPGVENRPAAYRDANKKLKKQAARFWVYAYDDQNPTAEPVVVEVGPGKPIARIEWTVHVANQKAAWFKFDGLTGSNDIMNPPDFGYANPGDLRNPGASRDQWTIDPGPSTASTPGETKGFSKTPTNGVWPTFDNGNATDITTLGHMNVEADSSLTVVGGSGRSGSINNSGIVNYANNPGWFDDSSDGSVTASLVFSDPNTPAKDAEPAWLIVGPPDFAPPIDNIVTLYDAMYDVALRELGTDKTIFDAGQFVASFKPSFEEHIYPILYRAFNYRWVRDPTAPSPPHYHSTMDRSHLDNLGTPPSNGNDPFKNSRVKIFNRLRDPALSDPQIDDGQMPKLAGDTGDSSALTLTATQYMIMTRWRDGAFTRGTGPLPPTTANAVTASGLDRAALEACVGGAFFPGIECGWIIRESRLYSAPFAFRFKHAVSASDVSGVWPGDVTKRSACPWQADFFECQDHWWPAQRPDTTRRSATDAAIVNWAEGLTKDMDMVMKWHELGLVVKDPASEIYYEVERNLPRS